MILEREVADAGGEGSGEGRPQFTAPRVFLATGQQGKAKGRLAVSLGSGERTEGPGRPRP